MKTDAMVGPIPDTVMIMAFSHTDAALNLSAPFEQVINC